MAEPIDFYFDFSSPYGYLGSLSIDAVAAKHGREVAWRPYMMGVAFPITGQKPLTQQPLRGDYALRDFARSARLVGAPFVMPGTFPIMALAASRAFYWLVDSDAAIARELAKALYRAYFSEGRDISPPAVVVEIAEKLGVDGGALGEALRDPAIKERLKTVTQGAIDRGIFGSPWFVVDGEPFWGADRLGEVDRWLETGGW